MGAEGREGIPETCLLQCPDAELYTQFSELVLGGQGILGGAFSCQIVSSVVTTGVLVSGPRDELPPNDNETLYRNKTTKQTPMRLISSPGCFPCLPAAGLVQSLLQLMKNRLLHFHFYSYKLCALPHFPWAKTERGRRIEEASPPTDSNSDILVSQIPLLISKRGQTQGPLSKKGA